MVVEIQSICQTAEAKGIRTTKEWHVYLVNGRVVRVDFYEEEVILLGYSP